MAKVTLGKAVTRDLAAIGVQNKFDKIIFSSSTLCSFNTAIALMTVFPVPMCVHMINIYILIILYLQYTKFITRM